MKSHIISSIVFSGVLLAAGGAQAAVIYNGGTPNDPDSFYFGDTSFVVSQVGDSFTLSPGGTTIGGVNWWGGCISSDGTCPAPGAFTLSFYADASGLPGTLINSYNVGNANQTYVTTGTYDVSEYSYEATIPDLTLTAGTQYWLGISDTTSTDYYWGWDTTTNAPDGLDNEASYEGGVWTLYGADLAFNLTSGSAAVPEPFTLSVFGAGLAGAAAMRRRKKRVA